MNYEGLPRKKRKALWNYELWIMNYEGLPRKKRKAL